MKGNSNSIKSIRFFYNSDVYLFCYTHYKLDKDCEIQDLNKIRFIKINRIYDLNK